MPVLPHAEKVAGTLDENTRFVGPMTPDEYIAFERVAHERHELWEGNVVQMAGASPEHNKISLNTARALADVLEAAGLENDTYGSDQKVYVSDRTLLYPEVSVADADAQFDDKDTLRNPILLVEVLSPSTAAFDLGRKFEQYRTIASLRHYLVIEQDRVSVTHYEKIAGDVWAIVATHTTLTDALTLNVGEAQAVVPVAQVYRRIVFSPETETV